MLELVQLVHGTPFPECLGITMPLARTLAARTVDVWMCVHRINIVNTIVVGREQGVSNNN